MPTLSTVQRNHARSLLISTLLLASCGAGDLAIREPLGGPVALAEPAPPEVKPIGPTQTAALESEGDLRLGEPLLHQARRDTDPDLHPLVLPVLSAAYPRMGSHAKGSISMGTVTTGFLVDAAEFSEEGPTYKVLTKVADRNTRFTTDEMKSLLLCAAERVHKQFPGQKLHLGNLSRAGGGALPWSVSHHNGRDADLGFYTRTVHGKVGEPDHLYHFNAALETTDSPEPLRFDVAANWVFVKALATQCSGPGHGPDIQYLFIANWLKQPLLTYGQKKKEDKEVLAKVGALLHQPHGALPHNDHLHLRIACSQDDATEGCLDASRAPPEAVGRSPSVQTRLPELRKALRAQDAATRAGAVQLLTLYRDPGSADDVLKALADPAPEVRKAALLAVLDWRPAGATQALAAAVDREQDPALLSEALYALAQFDTAAIVQRFEDKRVLASHAFDVPTVTVRELAVAMLSESQSLQVARAAVPLLADTSAPVRDAARRTLARIVNRTTADLLAETDPDHLLPSPLDPSMEQKLWAGFFERLPDNATRDGVALAGMQAHGLMLRGLDRTALPQLVQALALPAPYRDNAARWIERLVGFKFQTGKGAHATPVAFWTQWLTQKRMISPTLLATLPPGGALAAPTGDAD
jgi:penicillin-insensitive murein endopeptidase